MRHYWGLPLHLGHGTGPSRHLQCLGHAALAAICGGPLPLPGPSGSPRRGWPLWAACSAQYLCHSRSAGPAIGVPSSSNSLSS
eukprot:6931887-Heterocapsa_arctica.AAC.1